MSVQQLRKSSSRYARSGEQRNPAELLFRTLFEGGAAAIDEEEESCGRIEAGYQADLIGIELSAGRLIPSGNLLHTMFECAESGDVQDVIVGGKVLMQDREVKVLDEEQIRFKATEYMKKEGVLNMEIWLMTAAANLAVGALVGLCGVTRFSAPHILYRRSGDERIRGAGIQFCRIYRCGSIRCLELSKSGKSGREIRTEAKLWQSDRSDLLHVGSGRSDSGHAALGRVWHPHSYCGRSGAV